MANTTIDQLISLTGVDVANTDLLIIHDASSNTEKYIRADQLKIAIANPLLGTGISYSTGTFTPIVADAASLGNVGTGTFTGHYTKIGRQVTCIIALVDINTTGMTGTADLFIRGLPFTVGSLTGVILTPGAVIAAGLTYSGTNTNLSGVIQDATQYMRIAETAQSAGLDYITVNQVVSPTTDVYITITYFATS